jgi:tetratricopeptide (TPR) repeat protein
MYAEFSQRLRAVVSHAGDDLLVLEPCGFLWLAIGTPEEGLPILDRVAEIESANSDLARKAIVQEVLDAIRSGWNVAAAGVFSFTEAARKRAEPEPPPVESPPSPPAHSGPPSSAPAEESSSPTRTAGGGYEQEENIVRSALGRLQAKVDEEIGNTDPEARYNLGIAYKEMGLHDEAATEFRLAMRKPELFVGAGSLLADTLADRADFDGALTVLEAILAASIGGEEVRRDVQYHKAVLLENAGRRDEARVIFREIQEKAPGYRDVDARLRV